MIRLAKPEDAEQLFLLNQEFNGKDVVVMESFCYSKIYAEITEVFVTKEYRRRGYASKMIEFAQKYCQENFAVENFQLFTGRSNKSAQKLYKSLGYCKDDAILYRKS